MHKGMISIKVMPLFRPKAQHLQLIAEAKNPRQIWIRAVQAGYLQAHCLFDDELFEGGQLINLAHTGIA